MQQNDSSQGHRGSVAWVPVGWWWLLMSESLWISSRNQRSTEEETNLPWPHAHVTRRRHSTIISVHLHVEINSPDSQSQLQAPHWEGRWGWGKGKGCGRAYWLGAWWNEIWGSALALGDSGRRQWRQKCKLLWKREYQRIRRHTGHLCFRKEHHLLIWLHVTVQDLRNPTIHPHPQPLSFLFKYNLQVNRERLYTKTTRTQKAMINAFELMKCCPQSVVHQREINRAQPGRNKNRTIKKPGKLENPAYVRLKKRNKTVELK